MCGVLSYLCRTFVMSCHALAPGLWLARSRGHQQQGRTAQHDSRRLEH